MLMININTEFGMDVKLTTSRLTTEEQIRSEWRSGYAMQNIHSCPFCQCNRLLRNPLKNKNESESSQNLNFPLRNRCGEGVRLNTSNKIKHEIRVLRSESPRPQKITITYQSPPKYDRGRNLGSPDWRTDQTQKQPRPRILDRKKYHKSPPTHMEITFNPVKALNKIAQTQMTIPYTVNESYETPGKMKQSSNNSESIRLGYSKKTYISLMTQHVHETSIEEHI